MSLCGVQKSIAALAGIGTVGAFITYSNDTTQLQFDTATTVGSLLALLDAETAHRFGIWASKYRLVPHDSRPDPSSLATTVWGRQFVNPLGLTRQFLQTHQRHFAIDFKHMGPPEEEHHRNKQRSLCPSSGCAYVLAA